MSKHLIGRVAMFVTDESVSMDDVNTVLTSGHDYLRDYITGSDGGDWIFWVASERPVDAPKDTRGGTKAPIDDLPKFTGKDVGYLAKFLNEDLSAAFLKRRIFAVLDDRTTKDQSVKLCHFDTDDDHDEDRHGAKEYEVQTIRVTPRAAAFDLKGNSDWIELRENWERGKDEGNDVLDV